MTLFGLTSDYLLGMLCWCLTLFVGLWLLLKLRRRAHRLTFRMRFANFGLSVWFLCFLLTCVELGFALGYDRTDSFNMSNVSKKWFRKYAEPEEKALKFGPAEGIVYRDNKPFPEKIPEHATHLCFLGDSFTYGHGINRSADRFSNLVGTKLNSDAPGKYIVTNLGRPGTELFYAEAVLEHLFEEELRVDTVVYTLCLNDIESFHPDFQTYYSEGWMSGSDFFLFRDTYFFNLLYFRVRQAGRPQVKDYYEFVREYYDGEPWKLMQQKLQQMNELCRKNQCEFRLVIFPFLHDLGDDNPFEQVDEQIEKFCRKENIPVLDLLPVLTPHAGEGLVVSRFDAHPNELANWYAANAIYEWLSQQPENEQPKPEIEPLKAERPMPEAVDSE